MIALNRILCPVDLSEGSLHALDHAAAIARWYEAELTILHTFSDRVPADVIPALVGHAVHGPIEAGLQRRASAVRELRSFVTSADVRGIEIEEVVQEAPDVALEILVQAAVRRSDLLVLGTHGRSGFQRLLVGSVTDKVMRTADVPTLIVPARVRKVGVSAAPFRRILCAIDFSASALNALAYALSLAEENDAHLTLLHVINISPELKEVADEAGFEIDEMRSKGGTSCKKRLESLVPDSVRSFCTVTTEVAEGKPSTEILRVAASRDANVIVMGVHGRGAMDLLLSGSTTQETIRAARCPVLAVRKPQRQSGESSFPTSDL